MFKINKIFLSSLGLLIFLLLTIKYSNSLATEKSQGYSHPLDKTDKNTRNIIESVRIEREARQLVKQGRYEEAITKYREAIHPEFINHNWEMSTALASITKIYQHQENLQKALETLEEFHEISLPNDFYEDRKSELLSLLKAEEEGNTAAVYSHIDMIKQKHSNLLPPHKVGLVAETSLIRLYDYLGDYKNGIALIDEALTYPRLTEKKRQEYLKVRRAFELDQSEGTKGRPTQVLIESDILPW